MPARNSSPTVKETLPTHGTLTVWGYGAKIRVNCGHLIAEWGICDERYSAQLPRVNHRLDRLVLLDPEGYLSFEAVDWLINQNVHVLFLNRDGDMLGTIGPPRPRETSLLRAQVWAAENGAGLNIARGLIEYKLAGQERIARSKLRNAACADAIASL
jgi:CRISPR/Cas system-associated endonuclease Cas1